MPRSAATRLLLCAALCLPLPLRAQSAPADTARPAGAPAAPAPAEDTNPLAAEVRFAQFLQGPVSGGVEQAGEYGGRLQVELKVDTRKLGLWPGGTLAALAATRYGESASANAGAAIPVSIALIDPAPEGTATSLVALNYTQLLPFGKPGNELVLALGRFSTLELIPDGTGMTGYMNAAQIAPTHELRNVPATTLGATVALVLGGEPVFTLLAIDSRNSQMTSGLSDAFEHGVTLSPAVVLPTRFFGRTGHQGVRATWSSQEITPFDEIPHLFLPRRDPAAPVVERRSGGWSLTYTADQYVQEKAGPPHTGWRLYWQAGVADASTNPIGRYFNVGIGGDSPFRGRTRDRFGVGWAYTGFGDDFKELFDPLIHIEDEQSVEAFYNLAITPWLRFTADLQVIQPFRARVETAIVPGARLELVF
ncbi:MAG TPA: carbohydrate porin [Longimicrobium sp.]|nr:carbohydrate porin [Longimicrobium sp.]